MNQIGDRPEENITQRETASQPPGSALTDRIGTVLRLASLIGTVAVTGLTGCGQQDTSRSASANDTASQIVVCGIDRSGSYDFIDLGKRLCGTTVARARPGDEIVVRWISGASYRNREFAVRVELPDLPSCSSNRFDVRCRRERAANESRLRRRKRAYVERLLSLEPDDSEQTDILGFLQAAADAFRARSPSRERHLLLATDLLENVHHSVEPDLADAHVRVLAFETGADPQEAAERRRRWRERFLELGAADVRFEEAEVQP